MGLFSFGINMSNVCSTYTCTSRPHAFGAEFPNEEGVAMVEMAVCLPFFVLLLFGLLEIGFLLYQYPIATQAVYEAAHQASKALPTDANSSQDFASDLVDSTCESLVDVRFSRHGYVISVEEVELSDAFSLRIRAIPINALTLATGDYSAYSLFSTGTVIRLREAPSTSVATSGVVNCATLQKK